MTRLIVTTDSSAAGALQGAGLGDLVIAMERRLVWAPLPSQTECEAFFSPRMAQPNGLNWLDDTPVWRLERSGLKGRGLIDLLSECGSAELWMGPEPNAQLLLLWLLDHCGSDGAAASKLVMRPLDIAVGGLGPEGLVDRWRGGTYLTNDRLWQWDPEGLLTHRAGLVRTCSLRVFLYCVPFREAIVSHLILATNDSAENTLRQSGVANVALGFYPRFVWRKLPSDEQLLRGLERRSEKHCNPGDHWLDDVSSGALDGFGTRDIGLFELCEKFDSIEIWVDARPNDQLVLVWLLDLIRPYKEITSKLSLVHADDTIAYYAPESVAKWKLPAFKVTENHLIAASRAWRAYRAETPQPCFDLLMTDLMVLPRLRSALIAVLEELPDSVTGLAATEMDLLDSVNDGQTDPRLVEHARWLRDVFDENDAHDALLELGAYSAPPLLLGDPAFDNEDRYFGRSEWRLTLTELGRSLLAREDDMWRHNPIKRWWGGTELTNDRLWRWDRESRLLVAP